MTVPLVYRRTQISWPTVVPMALTALVVSAVFFSTHARLALTIGAGAVAVVRNGMCSNRIPLQRIKSATLDEQLPHVRGKTNGFAAGDTLRGSFSVDRWGSARLYVSLNHPPFVVIRSDDGFVAVNFVNPQQTREMYAQLRQALDR